MQAISHLWGILLEPQSSWAALKEKTHWWLPLVAVLVFGVLMNWLYYQNVDSEWLVQQMVAANESLTPEQRHQQQQVLTGDMMMYGAIGGMLIGMPIILAIFALYYFLVGKIIGTEQRFGQWYGFVCWTSIPVLISFLISILLIVLSDDGQISVDVLQPTSINYLLTNLPMGHPWQGIASQVSLLLLWQLFIGVVGYKVWTERSTATSTIIVTLPTVLIYGIWALVVAL